VLLHQKWWLKVSLRMEAKVLQQLTNEEVFKKGLANKPKIHTLLMIF
jgi:hypothetical protein